MRRILGNILKVVLVLTCSCRPVDVQEQVVENLPSVISVKIADVVNLRGPWAEGEAVSVYASPAPVDYTFNGNSNAFKSKSAEENKKDAYADRYYVLHPSSDGISPKQGEFNVTVPAVQKYKEGYIASDANIMVAVSKSRTDDKLNFHSALGYLRINLFGTDRIMSATLSGNNGEVISGTAVLRAEYDEIPDLSMKGTGKTVVLDCGSEGASSTADGIQLTFCLPPVTFEKGINVVVKTNEGEVVLRDENTLKISRGRVSDFYSGGAGTTFLSFGLKTSSGHVYYSDDLLGPDITVCVPKGTDLKKLTPVFTHSGETVKMRNSALVSGAVSADFTSAVPFTVKSNEDESADYKIHVVDYDIPVVYLSTPSHAPVVSKEEWITESTFLIQDTDGSIVDYGAASIKGRGNASWKREKKSYSIKLAVKPKDKPVLGLPGHKRWCMIAVQWGYLGNNVGYELARRSASYAWQPHGRYVEFVMNGKHIGTYFLAEQIRIDKNRVNIKSLKPEDIGEDKISGGYLLTYDRTYNDPVKFKSKHFDMPVMVKDPDDDEIVPEQFDYIQKYINEMEAAMADDARFAKHEYMDYFDIDTYIDMWFVWELAGATGSHGGADFAHPNSVWFYKDRGGKLKAGPCWDFDSYLFSTQKLLCNEGQYYGRLFKDPVFVARVKEKWPEFRASVEGRGKYATPITQFIDSCRNEVAYSAARNQKMWTWTKYKLDEEYNTIRNGLVAKLDWLEQQIMSFK